LLGQPKEEQKWKDEILKDAEKFITSAEHNFRHLYADALAKEPGDGRNEFTLNTFCDALVGITVHILAQYVGDAEQAEEMTVRALRTKYARFRLDKIRRKIMAGMEEAELYQVAVVNSKSEYERLSGRLSVVELSLWVNAHAAGFYAAARYVETPRALVDGWRWGKRQRPLHKWFDRKRADQMATQYIEGQFNGVNDKDLLLIRQASAIGFKVGGEFMAKALKIENN
jgi:hypothetical protein